jgi:hypothetical protein
MRSARWARGRHRREAMPASLGADVDAVVVAAMHCGLCVGGLDVTQDGEGMWFLV